MSTLQFVILLVVIFIATDGLSTVTKYVRKVRTLLVKHRIAKVRATLARHGVLFRNNSAKDFSALCLSEDFYSQPASDTGLRTVTPTFSFPIRLDEEVRRTYEDAGQKIIADFLYELCNRQYPRNWFSKELVGRLKNLMKSERALFVPQVMDPEKSLTLLKIRLDKYIQNNR